MTLEKLVTSLPVFESTLIQLGPADSQKTKRGLVENMAAKEIAVVFVIVSTISPSLSDNVISLTDVDFDDRVFSSSTHFVMFYGPW